MAKQRSRVTLPGADELFFRSSDPVDPEPARSTATAEPPSPGQPEADRAGPAPAQAPAPREAQASPPRPSGRQRHDEKITVYISAPELLALEQTRLTLRGNHGLAADRGRIVREAVAVLLADFEEHGESSMLVQRLNTY
ncbi:hypothetical protein [Streptomonospora wellingtoniae]|uniref:Cobyrinic acid a,c-diamide synthase n=1 Tax=Streptomonospora wellingtoniae TaxID=3075544 RepID=A0ABU2KVV6_9ACTN|nr:hypothetical protein [Streptomonospora sp. DSM 45055]MDT0303436.1 hypothetical protein [Streptomonospora sp. DSM 45055]